MEPWFAPIQVISALGITMPLFIYYSWRIYSLIIDHRAAYSYLKKKKWIDDILIHGWNSDPLAAELALGSVFYTFDKMLGTIRRSLRADVYIIILIGFTGTLLGMIAAFTTLLMAIGNRGLDPAIAITTLVRGGLSTALVSSLIAAVMGIIVMGYLSFTEKKIVELKDEMNTECLKRYRHSRSMALPAPDTTKGE